MVNGKLILICQSGGEFEKNVDGTMIYNGGDAQAVNINSEILFDDLKLKFAEICDLDLKTVSMKYFLPQNTRTLISISNEKDLKRMLDFHASSVTVDVFVNGKEGFDHGAMNGDAARETGIKVAESVNQTGDLSDTSSELLSTDATSDDSDSSDHAPGSPPTYPVKPNGQTPTIIDTNASKKRKVGRDDSISDDKKSPKRKRRISATDNGPANKIDDVSLKKLIGSWRESITGIGQDFKNVYDFRNALQKYAIAHRFVYKLEKNESCRASGKCVDKDCPWKIYASWVPGSNSFRIKKFNNLHTCVGQPWKYSHSTKTWLVNIIKESLRDFPHHKFKDIADAILRNFGIELDYMRVWRGIEDVYKGSYDHLPCYCDKIIDSNPGSYVKLITSVNKTFQAVFISLNASIDGFRSCRSLLFLEATSLKSIYGEVLLTATAIDGDERFFPVSFAIVDSENNENWNWFLEQLQSVLPTSKPMTFVSDREKWLKDNVVKVFPNSYHGYSMHNLLNSFRKNSKGPFYGEDNDYLPTYFVAAAHVTRVVAFRKFTEQIRQISSQAYDWLMQIEPECWTTISSKGESHNQITENVGELYSNLMEESKELSITKKIDAVISMIIGMMNTRKYESSKWVTILTPSREEKLHEEIVDARGLKVIPLSNTLFEVRDDVAHNLNLDKVECTCLGWQSTGLPCRHAIAAFKYKRKSLYDFCSNFFTVETFRSIYSETINPVPSELGTIKGEKTTDRAGVFPPSPSKSVNKPKI